MLISGSLAHGAAQSFESGIGVVNHTARVCSVNYFAKGWYVDACADQVRERKELMNATNSNVKLGINRYLTDAFQQNQLQFSVSTTHPQGIVTGIDTTFGEAVSGQLATQFFVAGRVGLYFLKKPLRVSASYHRSTGGLLLGFDRDSNTASISVSYPIWRNLTATLGYIKTDSNIDHFDVGGPSLDVQFAAIQF